MEVEDYKKLDSLFRFYGSEITAHSNYLIAFAFASAIYVYRVLDKWSYELLSLVIIGILLFFVLLPFLLGRLFYYTHLSNIVQHFMGVAYISEAQLKVYQDFLGAKLENSSSFGYKVANTLFYRVWRKLFNTDKVDFELYENFYDGITRIDELRWWEAYLIAFSNILQSSYRTMLRKKFIARAEN